MSCGSALLYIMYSSICYQILSMAMTVSHPYGLVQAPIYDLSHVGRNHHFRRSNIDLTRRYKPPAIYYVPSSTSACFAKILDQPSIGSRLRIIQETPIIAEGVNTACGIYQHRNHEKALARQQKSLGQYSNVDGLELNPNPVDTELQ